MEEYPREFTEVIADFARPKAERQAPETNAANELIEAKAAAVR
jgi:hypothetical protein